MSLGCPNYKTDPAEFERFRREDRRANRLPNAIALVITSGMIVGVCRVIYDAVRFAISFW